MQFTKKAKELTVPTDLLATYRQLAQLNGFALLKGDGFQQGRWDILTALPYQCQSINSVSDRLSLLNLSEEFSQPSIGPYPFQGGIIGYLSYDYGVLSHGLNLKRQYPYAQLPLVCMNWYRWCIVVDHCQKTATLIYDTDPDTFAKVDEVMSIWHQGNTCNTKSVTAKLETMWSMQDYEHAFNIIKQSLQAGRCYQVNLTQPYQLHSSASPWQLYEQIARQNPVPYGAFLDYSEHQIMSFSPECFITVDEDVITTKPIKGSISRCQDNPAVDKSLAKALVNSVKDRAENVMIVDLLRNDLSKVALKGSVVVNRLCELVSYPQIHHLVSEVRAVKKEHLSPLQVLLSAFPGGSITGAPKIEAMKMISELELTNRGPYCGSIFYYSHHGRLDSNIMIRSMTSVDNSYWLHAGGGIVIDSQLEHEYEECFIKISAILNAIREHYD